ncbi:MAG: hypothetical protein KQH79_12950 [Bacteroidetes bacterium]|nr:hypothetical protein [Bacteroidota bacterium]
MTGYDLTKSIFTLASSSSKARPYHIVLFLYMGELCNECNWPSRFKISRINALNTTCIGTQETYKKALKELEEWDTIIIHQLSKNQFEPYDVIEINERFLKKQKSLLNHNEIEANSFENQNDDIYYKTSKQDNPLTKNGIKDFIYRKEILKFLKLDKYDQKLFSKNVKHLISKNFEFLSQKDLSKVACELKFHEPSVPINLEIETVKDIISDILTYFGFDAEKDKGKKQNVIDFLQILSELNKVEDLKKQFSAYKEYKYKSGENKHSFLNFLGKKKENFLDGGWNAENWEFKLENIRINDEPKDRYQAGEKDHGKTL